MRRAEVPVAYRGQVTRRHTWSRGGFTVLKAHPASAPTTLRRSQKRKRVFYRPTNRIDLFMCDPDQGGPCFSMPMGRMQANMPTLKAL